MTITERLTKQHGKMLKLQEKLVNYGARDTEPDGHYQWAIAQALRGQSFVDLSSAEWELYSDEPRAADAAAELNDQTEYMVNIILKAPLKELDEIEKWVAENMWRISL